MLIDNFCIDNAEKCPQKNIQLLATLNFSLFKSLKWLKNTYLTFNCLWIANFFSICSIGNCGTSYGADSPFGSSGSLASNCELVKNDGLSFPKIHKILFKDFGLIPNLHQLKNKYHVY